MYSRKVNRHKKATTGATVLTKPSKIRTSSKRARKVSMTKNRGA